MEMDKTRDYCEIETLNGGKLFIINTNKNTLFLFFEMERDKFLRNEFSAIDAEGNKVFIKGEEIILGV